MSADYHVYNGQSQTPYDAVAIRGLVAAGRLTRDTWVFHEGETEGWTRAEEVPSLRPFFAIANAGRAVQKPKAFAEQLDEARTASVLAPPKPLATTELAPPEADDQIRRMETQLPNAPLSDLRHPHESIRMPPPAPIPTPGRWLSVLQRLFGRKPPS